LCTDPATLQAICDRLDGTEANVNAFDRHSRIKQYLR
jgi:hypothetical protein